MRLRPGPVACAAMIASSPATKRRPPFQLDDLDARHRDTSAALDWVERIRARLGTPFCVGL
jgi:hypothetical protein